MWVTLDSTFNCTRISIPNTNHLGAAPKLTSIYAKADWQAEAETKQRFFQADKGTVLANRQPFISFPTCRQLALHGFSEIVLYGLQTLMAASKVGVISCPQALSHSHGQSYCSSSNMDLFKQSTNWTGWLGWAGMVVLNLTSMNDSSTSDGGQLSTMWTFVPLSNAARQNGDRSGIRTVTVTASVARSQYGANFI